MTEESWFDSREGQDKTYRPTLDPTQPPIQWVQRFLSSEVMWPRREANHSSPSSVELKNDWNSTSTPPYAFMACSDNRTVSLIAVATERRKSS